MKDKKKIDSSLKIFIALVLIGIGAYSIYKIYDDVKKMEIFEIDFTICLYWGILLVLFIILLRTTIFKGNRKIDLDEKNNLSKYFVKDNSVNEATEKAMVNEYKKQSLSIYQILSHIPNYHDEEFKLNLFEIFKGAICSINNHDKFKTYVTDEFYNYVISNNIKGFDDIEYSKILLNNVIKDGKLLYLHTNVVFIDSKGKLFNYDVIFVRKIHLEENVCMNCGTEIENDSIIKCPKCNAQLDIYHNDYLIVNSKLES